MAETKKRKSNNKITHIRGKNKLNGAKGVNTLKYCGVIKLNEDPLIIQKRLRDEWQ